MASITVSSVAARAVAGRKTFLAGSSRVSAVAPKSAMKARFTVRAADEVRAHASRTTRVSSRGPEPTIGARARIDDRTSPAIVRTARRARGSSTASPRRVIRAAPDRFFEGDCRARGRFIIPVGVPPDPRSRASRVRPVPRDPTRHF